jgi:hypothetical protein
MKEDSNGAKRAIIVAIASAIIGGAGGPFLLIKFGGAEFVRPDPYTGSQARILESRVQTLERHVDNHPDVVNKFDRRITILEVKLQQIIFNQERIIEKLEDHEDR